MTAIRITICKCEARKKCIKKIKIMISWEIILIYIEYLKSQYILHFSLHTPIPKYLFSRDTSLGVGAEGRDFRLLSPSNFLTPPGTLRTIGCGHRALSGRPLEEKVLHTPPPLQVIALPRVVTPDYPRPSALAAMTGNCRPTPFARRRRESALMKRNDAERKLSPCERCKSMG